MRETTASQADGYEDMSLIGLLQVRRPRRQPTSPLTRRGRQLMTACYTCVGFAAKSTAGRAGQGLLQEVFHTCLFSIPTANKSAPPAPACASRAR